MTERVRLTVKPTIYRMPEITKYQTNYHVVDCTENDSSQSSLLKNTSIVQV